MRQSLVSLFLLPVSSLLLWGCDSAPEQGQGQPVANAEKAAEVAEKGFFSDYPRFIEVENIRQIGAKEGRPLAALERLNLRYGMIIEHHKDRIKGARILDFGSYDGRWTFAAIEAGAAYVKGIEINQDFVDHASQNMEELGVESDKYDFVVSDLLAMLKTIEPGTFDGIICAGIYYHITYHVELMKEMERLDVDWIIMDSSVEIEEKPIVKWSLSPYGLEGTPSLSAIKMIAEQNGFDYEDIALTPNESTGMWDYNSGYRKTLTLLPKKGAQ